MLTIKWNDLAWNYLTIEQSDQIPIILVILCAITQALKGQRMNIF